MDPRDFVVGWICALRTELAAAQAMLDEEYDTNNLQKDPLDDNIYTLGKIGNHKIVITCLSGSGNTQATAAAIHMRYAFPKLKYGFMVGIGGGAPSKRNDIRLGDIVVSDSVIQYDSVKRTQNGEVIIASKLAPPPTELLNLKNEVAARSEVDGSSITHHLEWMFCRHPVMKDPFGYPGQALDHLFKPEYIHQGDDTTCEACDYRNVIKRSIRTRDEPMVYHGTIASADVVMRDATRRDQLRERHGALCFEMEAAGLMNNFPCLIIRGICDYADSHKNKRWQRYAAVAVSALMKSSFPNLKASMTLLACHRSTNPAFMNHGSKVYPGKVVLIPISQ